MRVADPVGLAPRRTSHRFPLQGPLASMRESLVFLDPVPRTGHDRPGPGTGAKKACARLAADGVAVGRLEARFQAEIAAFARL